VTVLNSELRAEVESAKINRVAIAEQSRKLQIELRELKNQKIGERHRLDQELRDEREKRNFLFNQVKDREVKFNRAVDSMRQENEAVRAQLEKLRQQANNITTLEGNLRIREEQAILLIDTLKEVKAKSGVAIATKQVHDKIEGLESAKKKLEY